MGKRDYTVHLHCSYQNNNAIRRTHLFKFSLFNTTIIFLSLFCPFRLSLSYIVLFSPTYDQSCEYINYEQKILVRKGLFANLMCKIERSKTIRAWKPERDQSNALFQSKCLFFSHSSINFRSVNIIRSV